MWFTLLPARAGHLTLPAHSFIRPFNRRLKQASTLTFTWAITMGLTASLAAPSAWACSSCGCSLGTDWSDTGLSSARGLKLDLRYDFINQNQLRKGRSAYSYDTNNPPDDVEEIQQGTLTNFYTLSADYAFNGNWGLNVQLPYLIRLHDTVPLGEDGAEPLQTSDAHGIGDLRVVARYQGFFEDHHLGIQFGLKLPSGRIHDHFDASTDSDSGSASVGGFHPAHEGHDDGDSGPEALDRGLQLGTGTTDLILGIYDHGTFNAQWDRFEQLQYKVALNSRDDFRPSPQVNVNAGVRYIAHPGWVPQLQLNLKWEGRELGEQADYANSGSRVAYLSPGITVQLAQALHAYTFVQLPIYQDYTGYQLAPRYTVSAGLSYHF